VTPREWSNAPLNFDNVGNAFIALFVTSTLNGYTDIIENAMAAPELRGDQPAAGNSPGSLFFFVAFVMLVTFTLLNLFVGVVFYQFSRIRTLSQTGSAFLTNDQQEWCAPALPLCARAVRCPPPLYLLCPPARARAAAACGAQRPAAAAGHGLAAQPSSRADRRRRSPPPFPHLAS